MRTEQQLRNRIADLEDDNDSLRREIEKHSDSNLFVLVERIADALERIANTPR
jgi:uncharacterized protein Yka (UPF0111/DUF47 family)